MTNSDSINNSEIQENLRDYICYVITSAAELYREPHSYGPMRMVDALEKSLTILKDSGVSDSALEKPLDVIRENRWLAGTDPDRFLDTLNETILQLVDITIDEKSK